MLNFFTANWFWIVFVAGMLLMRLGHGGHGGGGCGGGHASQREPNQHDPSRSGNADGSGAATPAVSLSKSGNATVHRPRRI